MNPIEILTPLTSSGGVHFGSGIAEWGVKGFESNIFEIKTGFSVSVVLIGQVYGGSAQGIFGLVSNVGGDYQCRVRWLTELNPGVTVGYYWIAIG